MSKRKLMIIGAGGHGRVCADIAMQMGLWETVSFLDDNAIDVQILNSKVIGKTSEIKKYIHGYDFFVGIGNNAVREKFITKLKDAGASIATLIHPTAILGHQVNIGDGSAINAGVIINCCTKIGIGCIINTSAIIEHDNILGNYIHISPNATLCGNVKVVDKTWVGAGSVIINNVSIEKSCVIGAGAVVVKDIVESGTYVGVPARKINL